MKFDDYYRLDQLVLPRVFRWKMVLTFLTIIQQTGFILYQLHHMQLWTLRIAKCKVEKNSVALHGKLCPEAEGQKRKWWQRQTGLSLNWHHLSKSLCFLVLSVLIRPFSLLFLGRDLIFLLTPLLPLYGWLDIVLFKILFYFYRFSSVQSNPRLNNN